MQFKNILLAAFAGVVSINAQSIVDVLNSPELSTLKSLVTQFPDLVSTLSKGKITIVAPSNSAFQKFLSENPGADKDLDLVKNLLSYHVINGVYASSAITSSPRPVFVSTLLTSPKYSSVSGGQRVGAKAKSGGVVFLSGQLKESKVTTADVKFDGGVAHIVTDVLTIPTTISDTASALGLTQFADALDKAGLVNTADTTHDITVFAPDNDAFVDASLKIAGHETSVLSHHVVVGTVAYSSSLKNGQQINTLNDDSVAVTITGNAVKINDANVKFADVLTKNGVVHVISKVLIPAGTANANTGGVGGNTAAGGGNIGNVSSTNNQTNVTASSTNFTVSGTPTPTTMPVASTGAAMPNWGAMAVDKVIAAGFAVLAIGAAI